jgi:hypothetical protein
MLDITDDGLTAVVYAHVLHFDYLLAFAPIVFQRLDLGGEGARQLGEGPHGAIVLLGIGMGKPSCRDHAGVVDRRHLRDQQSFRGIRWSQTAHERQHGVELGLGQVDPVTGSLDNLLEHGAGEGEVARAYAVGPQSASNGLVWVMPRHVRYSAFDFDLGARMLHCSLGPTDELREGLTFRNSRFVSFCRRNLAFRCLREPRQ